MRRRFVAAARRAIRAQQEGNQVVMVVSAMGKQTDVLVDLAKQITDDPSAREMDMLLSTGEQVERRADGDGDPRRWAARR